MPAPSPRRRRSRRERQTARRQWIAFGVIMVVAISIIIALGIRG